jgi:hypothetical protein
VGGGGGVSRNTLLIKFFGVEIFDKKSMQNTRKTSKDQRNRLDVTFTVQTDRIQKLSTIRSHNIGLDSSLRVATNGLLTNFFVTDGV